MTCVLNIGGREETFTIDCLKPVHLDLERPVAVSPPQRRCQSPKGTDSVQAVGSAPPSASSVVVGGSCGSSPKRPHRRTPLIAAELRRYNIDIAVLSETRLLDEGSVTEEGMGYIFFWKGFPPGGQHLYRAARPLDLTPLPPPAGGYSLRMCPFFGAMAVVREAEIRGGGSGVSWSKYYTWPYTSSLNIIQSRKQAFQKPVGKEEFVKVRKRDLERLTTETMQIKDFLPKILNGEFLECFHQLEIAEKTLEKTEQENEQLQLDCDHFKARLKTAQEDCQKEREEKLASNLQLNEARQQLLQQAEYCTEMGAAVCTLLWRVSSNEESVKFILGGNKAEKFFTIVAQTLESFVKSTDENFKEDYDLDTDENRFVLALAGIVTNIAAVAYGREFLVNSSQILLEKLLQLLAEMKAGLCTKLKVLILMCLYNVSINLKGLQYISKNPGFIPLLACLLEDPDAEVCLQVLRLIQSLILEPEIFSKVKAQIHQSLPQHRIRELTNNRNPNLRSIASELLEDMKMLNF
ncbi:heat shock factor 2-binding protein [Mobula birostris]|uniref:heat shock factor 2-binding protein n=1 Tax=Mobula birostris TaxID=1983395 RepID=UPI003B280840